jgi:hypothetical protein
MAVQYSLVYTTNNEALRHGAIHTKVEKWSLEYMPPVLLERELDVTQLGPTKFRAMKSPQTKSSIAGVEAMLLTHLEKTISRDHKQLPLEPSRPDRRDDEE